MLLYFLRVSWLCARMVLKRKVYKLPCIVCPKVDFFEPTLFLGVEESVVVSMPSQEGSLKQYTDTPPVLDRFKKWFLYGIAGRLSYILLECEIYFSLVYYCCAERGCGDDAEGFCYNHSAFDDSKIPS